MAWALKLPLADEVIESGLVQDFDASLSGIGQELGAGAYSMRWENFFFYIWNYFWCVLTPVRLNKCHLLFNFSSLKYCMFGWLAFLPYWEVLFNLFNMLTMSVPTTSAGLFEMSWWMCFGTFCVWPSGEAQSVSCIPFHNCCAEN